MIFRSTFKNTNNFERSPHLNPSPFIKIVATSDDPLADDIYTSAKQIKAKSKKPIFLILFSVFVC